MKEDEYWYLKKKINDVLQIDLSGYKDHQMRRRLDGYISRANVTNIVTYCKTLERDKEASQKLRDFITINVSEFFRDKEQYEALRTQILPDLVKKSHNLNIWSAGCSNGSEPYSIAILLEEMNPYHHHRILATDIDIEIINKAKAGGPYIASDVRNVKPDLLKKYFTCANDEYRIIDRIKQRIEFRNQNLLKGPFEKNFDMIVCRNVVIYFADEAKRQLYQSFYDSLSDGGILFIGATETLLSGNDMGLVRLLTSFHKKVDRNAAGSAGKTRLMSAGINNEG